MKAKTFLDQFINLGWRLETEEEQSGKLVWVLLNEAGAEILVVIHEDRNDALKQHPGLVPYEQLSETEKDYDRHTSQQTLKLITPDRLAY